MEALELEPLQHPGITIETRSKSALTMMKNLTILDDATRAKVGEFVKFVKGLQTQIKGDRQDELAAAQKTVDAIKAARNLHLSTLVEAEAIAKKKMVDYDDAKIAKRRAEAQEEQRRQQREAEEKAIADAIALQEAGAYDLAEEVLQQAEEYKPEPIPIPKTPAPVADQHTTVRWNCRLVSLDVLVAAIVAGQAPDYTVKFDRAGANTAVKTIKDALTRNEGNGRPTRDKSKLEEIAELPNGTILTKEMIGAEIPGLEIYITKGMASGSYSDENVLR